MRKKNLCENKKKRMWPGREKIPLRVKQEAGKKTNQKYLTKKNNEMTIMAYTISS